MLFFLEKVCIYVQYLNKNSFPIYWEEITKPDYQSQPIPCDGYYLVRVHPKKNEDHEKLVESMRCHVSAKS